MFDCFEYWSDKNQTIWEDANGQICRANWYLEGWSNNGLVSTKTTLHKAF